MKQGPLNGTKVIEFGQNLAGPYCGQILSFLGADVTKIERPEGDDARRWGPPFIDIEDSPAVAFVALNRDKNSFVIDLTDDEDCHNLNRMIGEADVFVHNLRGDVPGQFGFSAEILTEQYPHLIYASLGAFGHKGPWKDRPGYEPIIQAVAGLMSINGDPSAPPARVGVSIVDLSTGMWTAIGILAALVNRAQNDKGCVVDTSLFETGLMWISTHAAMFSSAGVIPQRLSSGHPSLAPYQAFQCADGPLMVCPGNERLWKKFAVELDQAHWIDDKRFLTNELRVQRRDKINQMVDEVMIKKPRAHWIKKLEAAGVPNAPLNTVPEVLELSQTKALEMLYQPYEGSNAKFHGLPLSFNGIRAGNSSKAPRLNEHE
ncbi:MAG: carnitine dehydratase [Rhodospirillaceae bacterium]|nr:carnitine dehydratase [Rhodospirillaceae bacterium]|tara:strand:+ start:2770 stop:3891 length:1122 start_codon:yes stop_codon:yes gene_type:complete